MIKCLYIGLIIFILSLLTACTTNGGITLINRETGKKHKIELITNDVNDLSLYPNIIDGYYVKYSTTKTGDYITLGEEFNIVNNTLYFSYGIKEDFFDIKSVGKVNIETNDNIETDKEYVDSTITVEGEDYYIKEEAQIRLRGNTTLWTAKKSYKIKFNEKQDVLGMGADKDWALLANYFDPTYLRNYYAYKLSEALGLEFYCDLNFVEVYLNGQYIGLYLLTETVEASKNRVNIELDTDDTEVPFLLELDMKVVQDNPNYMDTLDDEMFLLDNSKYNGKIYPFATKYPKSFKDITSNQYQYIKDYIINTFESVRRDGDVYEKYIDVDSFINYFLIQELFMNVDLDYSSVYMYKSVGEKLKFGPIWDFDLSSGNVGYVDGYAYDKMLSDVNGGSYLFNELFKKDDFKQAFCDRFMDVNIDIIPAMLDSIDRNCKYLTNYAYKDNMKWNVLNEDNWARPDYLVGLNYQGQVTYFKAYLSKHNEWLKVNL